MGKAEKKYELELTRSEVALVSAGIKLMVTNHFELLALKEVNDLLKKMTGVMKEISKDDKSKKKK